MPRKRYKNKLKNKPMYREETKRGRERTPSRANKQFTCTYTLQYIGTLS